MKKLILSVAILFFIDLQGMSRSGRDSADSITQELSSSSLFPISENRTYYGSPSSWTSASRSTASQSTMRSISVASSTSPVTITEFSARSNSNSPTPASEVRSFARLFCSPDNYSRLMISAAFGNINGCEATLKSGIDHVKITGEPVKADVNEVNESGNSALHLAAQNGHESVVRLLLHHKATDRANRNGQTALNLAFSGGYFACIELLKPQEKRSDL